MINVEGNQIAPDDINTWNPAFDVTPAELITAIITNKGIVRLVSFVLLLLSSYK